MSTNTYDFVKPWGLRAFLARVIGFGLITSEGNAHKHQRKALTPAFNIKNIRALYPVMWEQAGLLVDGMAKESKEKGRIEVGAWASRLALDVIGTAALSRNFHSLVTSEHRVAESFLSILDPQPHMVVFFGLNLILPTTIAGLLPVKANRVVKAESKYVRSVCEEILDEKQAKLADSKRAGRGEEESNILGNMIASKEFNRDELVDQMLTFIAAGHETTASSISWACHILTLPAYAHYQQILRDEIRAAMPAVTGSGKLTAAAAPPHSVFESLPYLNGVCEEVLRLFPAVPTTLRESVRPTSIAGTAVPAGVWIVLTPWSINRNPRFWGADADRFRPERWIDSLPDGSSRPNKHGGAESNYCEITFLHGQRACIGRDFAKAELRCVIAAIFGRCERGISAESLAVFTVVSWQVGGYIGRLKGGGD
ncbi:putative cytochrome p450 protein [Neofusicoccum parvum]|uniref:Cytochrome p450 protein n=1 Tax=Neofusicoccum parvum TaxID=310453 RepID=A0ACB5S0M1_9PEZI|nr:putative cytochrome p450 protein [Neofusicoccum parvum]